jgi:transposase
VNAEADAQDSTLRLSMDAKALVKIGPFARGGKNRVRTKAADHDFEVQATVTPVGIFLPASDELFLYAVRSKVTSDCLVDRLLQWWESVKERFGQIKTLVMNLDNGPENHSHRTQFLQRLCEFAHTYQITIRLAYYPPYHSKYNTIERCWGILEQHWNGALLDSVDAVLHFAQTMTWKGKHPMVKLVETPYQTGVKLTKEAMKVVETHLQRWSSLEKWFVDIPSSLPAEIQQESRPSLQAKSLFQKRPRGRPRTRPLPDPTQPKRPRGRPRKPVVTESITPIAIPG